MEDIHHKRKKDTYNKHTTNIVTRGENLEDFSTRLRTQDTFLFLK